MLPLREPFNKILDACVELIWEGLGRVRFGSTWCGDETDVMRLTGCGPLEAYVSTYQLASCYLKFRTYNTKVTSKKKKQN